MRYSILPEDMYNKYTQEISELVNNVISLANCFTKECKERNISLDFASRWYLLQFQYSLNRGLLKNKKRKENKNVD